MNAVLRSTPRILRLVVTLAAQVAAVVALGALGSRPELRVPFGHLAGWLRTTPATDVVVATCRVVALVGAWWLLAGTLFYTVARAARVPGAARAAACITLPAVRRAVDTALFVSVATIGALSPVAAGAATSPVPPPSTVVRDGHSGALQSLPAASSPAPPTTEPAPAPPVTAKVETEIVVASGDNLWDLAARQLAATWSRPRTALADDEIARYWVQVCDRNRATLASGDPNLISPGERITLPAVN